VNLPYELLEMLRKNIERTSERTSLQDLQVIFDHVQHELLDLMQGDSYRRFCSSGDYLQYKEGANVPHREESDSFVSHTSQQRGIELDMFSGTISESTNQGVSSSHKESSKDEIIEPLEDTGGFEDPTPRKPGSTYFTSPTEKVEA